MKQNLKIVVLLLFLIHFSLILEAQNVISGISPVGELQISGTKSATSYSFGNYEFTASNGDIEKGKDLILKFDVRNSSNQNGNNVKIKIGKRPENVVANADLSFEVNSFSANSTQTFSFEFRVKENYASNSLSIPVEIYENGEMKASKSFVLTFNAEVGNIKALIVANSEYKSSAWGRLNNPQTSADALKSVLEEKYKVSDIQIENNLTIEQFKSVLTKMKEQVKPNDQFLFYFIGHGYFDYFTQEGYLVMYDSDGKSTGNMMQHVGLASFLNKFKSQQILVVLDACYSSTFDRSIALAMTMGEIGMKGKTLDKYIKDELNVKSRLYLTSGESETSTGTKGLSPFSQAFIDALRNYEFQKDGVTTYYEIRTAIDNQKIIPTPRGGSFGDHITGGNFLFIVK